MSIVPTDHVLSAMEVGENRMGHSVSTIYFVIVDVVHHRIKKGEMLG